MVSSVTQRLSVIPAVGALFASTAISLLAAGATFAATNPMTLGFMTELEGYILIYGLIPALLSVCLSFYRSPSIWLPGFLSLSWLCLVLLYWAKTPTEYYGVFPVDRVLPWFWQAFPAQVIFGVTFPASRFLLSRLVVTRSHQQPPSPRA